MNLQLIVEKLVDHEKKELLSILKKELEKESQLDQVRLEVDEVQKKYCPYCYSNNIYGHGTYKGRKRCRCKECKKTFNDFTGTVISGIKKVDKFKEYVECVFESVSIRKAAKKLKISTNTIFDWRHKILTSLLAVDKDSFV